MLDEVNGQGENDGRVLLGRYGVEGLKVAELERRTRLGDHLGGLFEGSRGLLLTLGCDHLEFHTNRSLIVDSQQNGPDQGTLARASRAASASAAMARCS